MRAVARLFVPGRIELLGKHTDYAGGSSLLVAVERGFTFEAFPLPADEVVVRAAATDEEARWRVERRGGRRGEPAAVVRRLRAASASPDWARYAEAVLGRLGAEFGEALTGARIVFTSNLPIAAGLSSSSALLTGVFLALDAVCRFSELPAFQAEVPDREALATWLAAAEAGRAVGTRGGSEDHAAILLARPGEVVRYAFAPLRPRGAAPVPPGWTFAVGASGVVAEKGDGARAAFNRLSDLAAGAARAWVAGIRPSPGGAGGPGGAPPHLGAARAASPDDDTFLAAIRAGAPSVGADPDPLVRRARHFLEECTLADAAFDALVAGDVPAFADAVNRSAARGAELLANQVPETLALTELARDLGAAAASPFGAGFGGAVWALVPVDEAAAILATWEHVYRGRFSGRRGTFFVTTAVGPARVL